MFTSRLFRRQVVGRAPDIPSLDHGGRGQGPGDAKIGYFYPPIRGDQDVLRLDVAVDETSLVRRADGGTDLDGNGQSALDGERSAFEDQLLEIAALDVLHDDVMTVAILANVVDADNVRMVQVGRRLGFAVETRQESLIVCASLIQHLDSHRAPQHDVLSPVDCSHAALAHDRQ